jgi:hypothetical protein
VHLELINVVLGDYFNSDTSSVFGNVDFRKVSTLTLVTPILDDDDDISDTLFDKTGDHIQSLNLLGNYSSFHFPEAFYLNIAREFPNLTQLTCPLPEIHEFFDQSYPTVQHLTMIVRWDYGEPLEEQSIPEFIRELEFAIAEGHFSALRTLSLVGAEERDIEEQLTLTCEDRGIELAVE